MTKQSNPPQSLIDLKQAFFFADTDHTKEAFESASTWLVEFQVAVPLSEYKAAQAEILKSPTLSQQAVQQTLRKLVGSSVFLATPEQLKSGSTLPPENAQLQLTPFIEFKTAPDPSGASFHRILKLPLTPDQKHVLVNCVVEIPTSVIKQFPMTLLAYPSSVSFHAGSPIQKNELKQTQINDFHKNLLEMQRASFMDLSKLTPQIVESFEAILHKHALIWKFWPSSFGTSLKNNPHLPLTLHQGSNSLFRFDTTSDEAKLKNIWISQPSAHHPAYGFWVIRYDQKDHVAAIHPIESSAKADTEHQKEYLKLLTPYDHKKVYFLKAQALDKTQQQGGGIGQVIQQKTQFPIQTPQVFFNLKVDPWSKTPMSQVLQKLDASYQNDVQMCDYFVLTVAPDSSNIHPPQLPVYQAAHTNSQSPLIQGKNTLSRSEFVSLGFGDPVTPGGTPYKLYGFFEGFRKDQSNPQISGRIILQRK